MNKYDFQNKAPTTDGKVKHLVCFLVIIIVNEQLKREAGDHCD